MKLKSDLSLPITLLGCIILAAGCSSDECLDNSSALPQAGFFSSQTNPQKISLKGVRIRALDVPGDSILSASSAALETVYLPFNLEADSTSYLFTYPASGGSPQMTDTVTFHYICQPWFVSSACGAVVNFSVEKIEHTSLMIDSVTCPGKVITNAAGVNINIYFKESENED